MPDVGRGKPCPYERYSRQFALQIFGIAFAVLRVVQHRVDVMEDLALADAFAVLRAELCQRSIGDVLAAVAPVLVVGVEREAL